MPDVTHWDIRASLWPSTLSPLRPIAWETLAVHTLTPRKSLLFSAVQRPNASLDRYATLVFAMIYLNIHCRR